MKQIQMDIMGIMRFMVFMLISACPAWGGLVAWLIFIDAQERNAAMIGIRNRPMVARISALEKSKFQIFQSGIEPRFIPRKL